MDYIAKFIEKWFSRRDGEALLAAGLSDASRFHCRKPLRRSIAEMLVKLPSLKVFQFHDIKPDTATLEHLNEIVFKNRKDVTLRVYGYPDTWANIDFLKSLPEVERFDWDTPVFGSDEPLYKLKRLVHLGLGFTQPKPKIDIGYLTDFPSLESLNLEGDYKKLQQTVSQIRGLKSIWLSSIE